MSAWSPSGEKLSALGRAAFWYATKGWAVFPCKRDKTPYVLNGHLEATTDEEQIRAWWRRWPNASIGCNCERSGLVAIDTDVRNGGHTTIDWLLEGGHPTLPHLGPLPHTPQSFTGSGDGSNHRFFRNPGLRFRGTLGDGIDVKSNGYVILPPSRHPSGGTYRWEASSTPDETVISDLPEAWLRAAVREAAKEYAPGDLPAEKSLLGLAFGYAGLIGGKTHDGGKLLVVCPWEDEHTSGERFNSSTVLFPPAEGKETGWFHCSHGHCAGRTVRDVLAALPEEAVFQAEQDIAARILDDKDRPITLTTAAEGQRLVREAIRNARPGFITIARVPPGLGKTKELHDCLSDTQEAAAVLVPDHRLAGEHKVRLAVIGVPSSVKKGVRPYYLEQADGSQGPSACLDLERAETIAKLGGVPRQELCPVCPHREKHPATGQECIAYAAMSKSADVTILQASIAAPVLSNMADALTDPNRTTPTVKLMASDEPGPLTVQVTLRESTAADVEKSLSELGETTRDSIAELWSVVQGALSDPKGLDSGISLRQLVGSDGAIAEAATLASVEWPSAVRHRLAKEAPSEFLTSWCNRLDHAAAVLGALLEGAIRPDAPFFFVDDRTGDRSFAHLSRHVRETLRFAEAGGRVIVLDATAYVDAWRSALGCMPDVTNVDVADAVCVKRRWFYWGSAARSRHLEKAHEVRGVLRAFAGVLRETGAKTCGLITDKPTAEEIEFELEEIGKGEESSVELRLLPPELVAQLRAGLVLTVGHFGAIRGLDCWADVDVLGVMGEDWQNLGSSFAAARVLGLDPQAYAIQLLQAEMTQAEGRGRPVHRTKPLTIVRFSRMPPDTTMAPQWIGVKGELLTMGRPRKVDGHGVQLDASGWAEERERLGGISGREHARRLGVDHATYLRAEARLPKHDAHDAAQRPLVQKSYQIKRDQEPNPTTETSLPGLLNHDEPGSAIRQTDPSTWPTERERLGLSRPKHAVELGLAWTTYRRLEATVAPASQTPEKPAPVEEAPLAALPPVASLQDPLAPPLRGPVPPPANDGAETEPESSAVWSLRNVIPLPLAVGDDERGEFYPPTDEASHRALWRAWGDSA